MKNKTTPPQQRSLRKGLLLAILAFFCMAIFGVLTKLAYEPNKEIWISFITYLTGTIGITTFIAPKGMTYLKSNHYGYLYGRALFGTAASFLYMISLNFTSIVNSTLLFNTAPIFIPLLTVFWLKKPVLNTIWYAVIIGFIGILIIIKPGRDMLTEPGNLIGLLSGMSLAIAYLLMKLLTGSDPGYRIIFYYLFIGTLAQLPLLYFAGPFPSSKALTYSVASGLMLLLAQLALVRAYLYADASQVGVYQYSSIMFVAILEWLLWGFAPSFSDLLGMLLVIIAGIIIIRTNK